MNKTKVGVVGCGNISSIYLENLTTLFKEVEVLAVADVISERAQSQAEKYHVPFVLSTEEILAHPEIDIILNLTTPPYHFEVCQKALLAGKSVYVEKPLSIKLEDGRALQKLAAEKGLLLGGAPDTFLGAGLQTCIELIHSGKLGQIVGATAFMACHGHESWHPDPEFYYQVGGGPMFDMGPYYLTALFAMLGPARRVTGSTRISFPERTITSEKKHGQKVTVEVPTHVAGIIDFESQAMATILTSFDMWESNLPRIEIYGSLGTLSVPDPNTFGGPVKLHLAGKEGFEEIPLTRPFSENSRGLGVADMARALRQGSKNFCANGDLTLHVLEAMHGFHIAAEEDKHYFMQSRFSSPVLLEDATAL